MNTIELLAPAKDIECAKAAIISGADAVYIGAPKFGARYAASNQLAELSELINYAHLFHVKIYIALNIVLKDHELPETLELIQRLYEMKADAVIIQDLGLLELDLPPIPLFGSTQLDNRTPEKVLFLEKIGLQRVILARELNLQEILAIRAKTTVALESFIQGALCVSYSGQCYFSYALGGRSGNRGKCAQPCRRQYSLLDENNQLLAKDKYLLSLKDLNLSAHLSELIEAGVTSFKIEGRLKDAAYVRNLVAYYRQELDKVLAQKKLRRSSSGITLLDFTPDPAKTFNRGFTDYFIQDRQAVMSPHTPKSLGEFIGKVKLVQSNRFILDRPADLHSGDGICFLDKQKNLYGTTINQVEGDYVWPNELKKLEPDTVIFRNHNHEFLKKLNNSQTKRKINLKMSLTETPHGLTLSAEDEDGLSAEVTIAIEKTIAQKPEQAWETMRKQLAKLGDTIFQSQALELKLDKPYFLPINILNQLRRNVCEKLSAERLAKYARTEIKITPNNYPYPERTLDYQGNVLNKKAEEFYQRHGVTQIAPAAETGLDMHGKKVMTTKHCLRYELKQCSRQTQNSQDWSLLDSENGNKYRLTFNCAKCEMEIWF